MPILAVVGIDEEGQRDVLAFTVGERENQDGLGRLAGGAERARRRNVDLWITDGNKAMLNAIAKKFSESQRQRCIKHKMENVLGYIPEKLQDQVRPELKAIFYQTGREKGRSRSSPLSSPSTRSHQSTRDDGVAFENVIHKPVFIVVSEG